MDNINSKINTMDFLDGVITNFAQGYTELVKYGGENAVLDAALQAYVDLIYKEKISELCGVPKGTINDDLLRYIQSGAQYEKLVNNGKLTMYRRSYTDEEIKDIVKRRYNEINEDLNNIHSNNFTLENVDNDVTEQITESPKNIPKQKLSEEIDAVDSITNDNMENNVVTELNTETESISSNDLDITSIFNCNNKIAATDLKVQELIEKYVNTKASEKLSDAISLIYKTVLSKITGIARDDIKDSVCNRIQAGISEDVVDENGNIVTRRRSLTDEEAKLIVTYINQMSDEDVERFVGESNAQLEQKTL
jgi:hypothetical protein